MMKNNLSDSTITKLYYMCLIIIFFVLGLTFQAGIPRRIIYICFFCIFLSVIILSHLKKSDFLKNKKNIFDIREILILISMSVYRISLYYYYTDKNDKSEIIIGISAALFIYLIGKYYMLYRDGNAEGLVYSFGLGLMIFNLISIFSWFYLPYDPDMSRRYWQTLLMPSAGDQAATFFAFHPLLFISLIPYGILILKKNKVFGLIISLTGVFSVLWFTIAVKTRSPLMVFLCTVIASVFIYVVHLISKNGFDKYKKKIMISSVVILVAVGVVIFCFCNISSLNEWYKSSFMARNGGIFNNLRVIWAKETFMDLKDYPFGGNQRVFEYNNGTGKKINVSHMTWSDIVYTGGIIPFISIFLWLMLALKDIISVIISNKIELSKKMLCILPFIAIFLYSCTEALLRGLYYEFFVLLLFGGMIRGQVLLYKNDK